MGRRAARMRASRSAYNPTVLATPQTSQGLSGAGLTTPTQPPVITGPGTTFQTSVGRPIPVTLNTAPAAVAAPVPLEQIMQEQQVQEQREAQELMVPQSFASTVKGRGRGLKVTIMQNTPGPAELSAMIPRKYVPRPAGRNAPVDQMETVETDDEMLEEIITEERTSRLKTKK